MKGSTGVWRGLGSGLTSLVSLSSAYINHVILLIITITDTDGNNTSSSKKNTTIMIVMISNAHTPHFTPNNPRKSIMHLRHIQGFEPHFLQEPSGEICLRPESLEPRIKAALLSGIRVPLAHGAMCTRPPRAYGRAARRSYRLEGLGSIQTQAFKRFGRDSGCTEIKRLELKSCPGFVNRDASHPDTKSTSCVRLDVYQRRFEVI